MNNNRITVIDNSSLEFLVNQYQNTTESSDYVSCSFRAITKIVENCDTEIIVFWWASEAMPSPFLEYMTYDDLTKNRKDYIKEYEDELEQSGKYMYVVAGSFLTNSMKKTLNDYPLKNTEILVWKTCTLFETVTAVEKKFQKKISDIKINKNFNHLFFSLNGKARENRELLIDTLAKYDLLKYGRVSRNNWGKEQGFKSEYEFKYWKPEELIIDFKYGMDRGAYNHLSEILINIDALIDLVGETLYLNNFCFHTEKTYIPILLGRPFIVQSTINHHKELSEIYGIELYNEIFDYEFDNVFSLEKKTEMIVSQMDQLKNRDYYEIYNSLEDKLNYNKIQLLKMIEDESFFPEKLSELVRYSPESFRNRLINKTIYDQLIKLSFN